MTQETVWTPNGDAMLSPITPPEFEPATSQQPTPEQFAKLAAYANLVLQHEQE